MIQRILTLLIAIPCLLTAWPAGEQANDTFRASYRAAKEKLLAEQEVIILATGNCVTLLYSGQREAVHYLPDEYHRLKEISHIPLRLYVESLLEESSPEELRLTIVNLLDHLQESGLPSELLEQQREILEKSALSPLSQEELFAALQPLLLANAERAAMTQLNALHNQIQQWKKRIPREKWDKLAVIVMGPQMPRIGEVTMQYFSRLTGTPLEAPAGDTTWFSSWNAKEVMSKPSKKQRRLLYAESIYDEAAALDLLATHLLDEKIGRAFFGDELRMQIDLLAEAASKALESACDAK